MNMTNDFGDKISEVLVQERIIGTEYVVNILSRNGFHKLTTFLKYKRLRQVKADIFMTTLNISISLSRGTLN